MSSLWLFVLMSRNTHAVSADPGEFMDQTFLCFRINCSVRTHNPGGFQSRSDDYFWCSSFRLETDRWIFRVCAPDACDPVEFVEKLLTIGLYTRCNLFVYRTIQMFLLVLLGILDLT